TVEQQTAGSTGFDNIATIRPDRESSGFSKRTPFGATSRQPAGGAVGQPRGERPSGSSRPGEAMAEPGGGRENTGRSAVETAKGRSEHQIDGRRPSTTRSEPLSGIRSDGPRSAVRREPPPALPPYLADLVARYSQELHDPDHVPQ